MKSTPFDIAEHLETLEDIQEFLREVDDPGDDESCSGSRGSLYKSLAPGANPQFKTISKVTRVFGLKLKAA